MASFFPGWFTSCWVRHDSITICCTDYKYTKGRFKCYVTQWGGSASAEKSVTKVYGSTLLALRGVDGGQISREKTLEWPLD